MLGKLLKYDIKAEFKSLLPLYIVLMVMPIALRIMDYITARFPVFNTFFGLLIFAYVMVIIGVLVWTLVVAVKHFYNNILKDEGYLTNTLPVKRSHIILSKEIVSVLTFVVSTILVFLSLFIGLYHGGVKELLDFISEVLSINYSIDVISIMLWVLATMLVTYVSQIQIFYLAMLLGQTRNTNKVLFSFVFGIIIYIVMQFVSVIGLGVDYLISPEMVEVMESTTATASEVFHGVQLILGTTLVISVICLVVIHYICVYIVNRKLNLE